MRPAMYNPAPPSPGEQAQPDVIAKKKWEIAFASIPE